MTKWGHGRRGKMNSSSTSQAGWSAPVPPAQSPSITGVPSPPAGSSPDPPGAELLDAGTWLDLAAQLRLSPREFQILQGVFDNLKESALAQRLGISPHTAHAHLNHIYRKLHATTRAQLILCVWALTLDKHFRSRASTPDQGIDDQSNPG